MRFLSDFWKIDEARSPPPAKQVGGLCVMDDDEK
jgi:hypothetical protein